MEKPEFVHVSYISAPPERVWHALTSGEFTKQYWFGRRVESSWQKGCPVMFWDDEGHGLDVTGEVLDSNPSRRLSYSWHVEYDSAFQIEAASRVTFELEDMGGCTRLRVIHDHFDPQSRIVDGIQKGWPAILSSLKSLLETGISLVIAASECQA